MLSNICERGKRWNNLSCIWMGILILFYFLIVNKFTLWTEVLEKLIVCSYVTGTMFLPIKPQISAVCIKYYPAKIVLMIMLSFKERMHLEITLPGANLQVHEFFSDDQFNDFICSCTELSWKCCRNSSSYSTWQLVILHMRLVLQDHFLLCSYQLHPLSAHFCFHQHCFPLFSCSKSYHRFCKKNRTDHIMLLILFKFFFFLPESSVNVQLS